MGYLKKIAFKLKFTLNFIHKRKGLADERFSIKWKDRYICSDDATQITQFDSHYVYHTAWAARILAKARPATHVDISSCLRFVTLVSAFIPIEFYDYRPASLTLSGLNSHKGDLLNLPFKNNSIKSLSCMHVIEHIGLERYGDLFDPRGDLNAINELKRVVEPGGSILIVVPVGENPRIQYNAHRIYSYSQIVSYFSDFKLENFSYVNDIGEFYSPADETSTRNQIYGCGCFQFIK